MAQSKNAKRNRRAKKGLCGPGYIMPDSKETMKETTKLLSNQDKKRQRLIRNKMD